MPSPSIFAPLISGLPLSSVDQNSNWALVESSFADISPYISSGLIPTVGTGLSVNVSSGTAVIGAHLAPASFVIGGLTPSTTVHLYLNQNGTGTSNTTGTQPANSVKLGTALTGASTVTSVNTLRSSGRQVFVRPENQVPGAVGSMGSINLASWAAAAADNVPVFGVLPAGAVPATSVPLTLTLNDANQNSVQGVLTVSHTYNAGGGATGIGSAIDFVAESATDGTLRTPVELRGVLTDATAATATGRFDVLALDNNSPTTPFSVASRSINIPQTTATSGLHGLLNIGSGGFSGSAGHFAGDSPGTLLAMNAPSGYTGTYVDVQKNGVRLFYLDQFGTLFRLSSPVGTANDGQLSLGPDFAHFDGSTTGKFTGSASGTYLAINAQSGFGGNLIDAQTHGVAAFSVSAAGAMTAVGATLTGDLTLSTHNLITDTTTGTKIGTGTTQKLGFFNATPVAQIAGNTDILAGMVTLGFRAASSAPPLDMNGGALTTGRINNAGQYGGSGAPCQFKRFSLTFPSDADYTLATNEKDAYWIDVQTGVITATRNIIVPVQAQMIYLIQNRNTQAVTLKTSGGTGITIAAGRCAWVGSSNGTNMSRLSSDVDFTV